MIVAVQKIEDSANIAVGSHLFLLVPVSTFLYSIQGFYTILWLYALTTYCCFPFDACHHGVRTLHGVLPESMSDFEDRKCQRLSHQAIEQTKKEG